jgi:predicted dehydrogenase
VINIGIISTARANRNTLILPCEKYQDVKIVAVASRNFERAQKYCNTYNIKKFYGSYDEILEDKEVDLIYISLPNSMHFEYVLKSLEKGKHVFCEKPMCFNKTQSTLIKNIALEKKLLVFDAMHYFYYPDIEQTIKLINGGFFGKVKKIYINFGLKNPPIDDIRLKKETMGGAFMHLGCYCLHFVQSCLNEKIDLSYVASEKQNEVDIKTDVYLKTNSTKIFISCNIKQTRHISSFIKIITKKGVIRLLNPFNPTLVFGHESLVRKTLKTLKITFANKVVPTKDYKMTSYDFQLQKLTQMIKEENFTPVMHEEIYGLISQISQIIFG